MSERNSLAEEVFVEEHSIDGERFWQKVDDSLNRTGGVFIRSPLLDSLGIPLGQMRGGRYWLSVESKGKESKEWLFRLRDVILSFLGLVLLSPIMMIIALLVKLSSPGRIFYKTRVIGQDRKEFVWRKFRSMRVMDEDADAALRKEKFREFVENRQSNMARGGSTKTIDHDRVTPIGRIIRKFSVDELPQLWNVICGQMSLVGPRPCLPYEADFYTEWRSRRFNVRPGLTGVWQVFGRGRTSFDESVAMDIYYLYRRSFLFDLFLILKTVGAVLTGKGAK
jgi:lipopolysaccharide/colanic/teichoic acid biosynthesis glycosyltransferase